MGIKVLPVQRFQDAARAAIETSARLRTDLAPCVYRWIRLGACDRRPDGVSLIGKQFKRCDD